MIKIMRITKEPLKQIGSIAGVCYNTTNEKYFKNIALQCINEGHWRTLEFPELIFEYDKYSAKAIRELYTHVHTTKLQSSTRYIDYSKQFKYATPFSIKKNQEANEIWEKHMEQVQITMNKLKSLNIPTEDYTNILPIAYETKGVIKMGLRELIQIFNVRACSCAYHEIRVLMQDLKKAIKETNDEEWIWIADNYLVPKCDLKLFCEEEKRWDKCKRHPKKSQVKSWIEEKRNNTDWKK